MRTLATARMTSIPAPLPGADLITPASNRGFLFSGRAVAIQPVDCTWFTTKLMTSDLTMGLGK